MIYDDETARQLFIEAKSIYKDREMLKWINGFFTSELISANKAAKEERKRVNKQKDQMSHAEIASVISTAQIKSRQVCVQLEALDSDGNYLDDIIGVISGYDELGIYVANQKVDYDEIRNIELYFPKKWSSFNDTD